MNKPFEKGTIYCPPNPEFLIKSIAEQGYSLETAFADLIDNSISASADKIEILSVCENNFTVFVTDNGSGMSKEKLLEALSIPSSSVENNREKNDLGRFGLGLKTASFSQTRELIVLSKKSHEKFYRGFCWDVELLKKTEDWTLKELSDTKINHLMQFYQKTTANHLGRFENYQPNTIVIWKGLYKYESFLEEENRVKALNSDLSENVEEYLSIAFHRFIEKGLQIRLNNKIVGSFNPFPQLESVINIPKRRGEIKGSVVKFESIVLPYCAIKESKESINMWTTPRKGLMDMEGIYIYRGDRLISYGGWHGIIKRSGKLQLGRMKIDIGNEIDNILKLNVAKSQIEIPYELKQEFFKGLEELKDNAQREFYNTGLKEIGFRGGDKSVKAEEIFNKVYTNKGTLLYVNEKNPLVDFMFESFDEEQKKLFRVFVKNFNAIFNKNRNFDSDLVISEDSDILSLDEIETAIAKLRELGVDEDSIKRIYFSNIVPKKDVNHIL